MSTGDRGGKDTGAYAGLDELTRIKDNFEGEIRRQPGATG